MTNDMDLVSCHNCNLDWIDQFPPPRYLHACSPVQLGGDTLGAIVAGGYSDSYLNSTEIFHPQLNRWSHVNKYSLHSLQSIKQKFYGNWNDFPGCGAELIEFTKKEKYIHCHNKNKTAYANHQSTFGMHFEREKHFFFTLFCVWGGWSRVAPVSPGREPSWRCWMGNQLSWEDSTTTTNTQQWWSSSTQTQVRNILFIKPLSSLHQ